MEIMEYKETKELLEKHEEKMRNILNDITESLHKENGEQWSDIKTMMEDIVANKISIYEAINILKTKQFAMWLLCGGLCSLLTGFFIYSITKIF